MRDVFVGASYPFRALGVIRRNPGLWRYVLWPVLLNIVIGVTVYAAALAAGFRAIDAWMLTFPEWLRFAGALLQAILVVALFALTGFLLVRFGVVLGSPFYQRLSERLEELVTGQAPPSQVATVGPVLRDLWRAVRFEVQKLLLVVLVALPLVLLGFIPAIGQVFDLLGWPALGALIACLDFFDPPLERKQFGFRQKFRTIRRALPASAGFGLVCFALVSIPLINFFSIPLCITAGTLFYCDRLRLERR